MTLNSSPHDQKEDYQCSQTVLGAFLAQPIWEIKRYGLHQSQWLLVTMTFREERDFKTTIGKQRQPKLRISV